MGNELKLSLENFQSISHGELIFHAGTNVIIGQSNSGKTATFRALKACLSNPAGSQRFIKKGTKKSSVALEYNGNQIIWKRTPTESSYTINGENFIKTGKSNAFKLVEDTGFVIDSNDIIMNIEEELQLPFPFGISKSDLFKLYENVFCISDSAIILKAAKAKEDEVKTEISTIENEIIKSKNKLEAILTFKKEVDINDLKEKRNRLKKSSERISFLSKDLDIIHKTVKIQGFEIPENSFENKLISLNDKISLKKEFVKLQKFHKLSKDLLKIETPKVTDLSNYNELKFLNKTCQQLKKLKAFEVPLIDFENVCFKYEDLKNFKNLCLQLKELEELEAPIKDFKNKLDYYKDLQTYSLILNNIKEEVKSKKDKLNETLKVVKEKEDKLKEFKICPLCHKPID